MSKSVGDVEMLLEEWLSLLDITEEQDYIIIRVRKILPKDEFSKLAAAVRKGGGEYISAGKETHFRIPKKQEPSPVTMEGLVYCAHCGKANKVRLEKA